MSRRRYISTEISTDEKVLELAKFGPLPLLIYTWSIPHMDDWGRMKGDLRQFKLLVCPGLDVSADQIEEAIKQIESVGLWQYYEVDGKLYIAIPKDSWFKYQTYINTKKREVDTSNFPAPPQHRKTPNITEEHRSLSPSPSPLNNKDILSAPSEPPAQIDLPDSQKINQKTDQELIFNHWNDQKIIKHRKLTDKFRRVINTALKDYTPEEIIQAITNYATIQKGAEYFWEHGWPLDKFLKRGLDEFLDWDVCSKNYLRKDATGKPTQRKLIDDDTAQYLTELKEKKERKKNAEQSTTEQQRSGTGGSGIYVAGESRGSPGNTG